MKRAALVGIFLLALGGFAAGQNLQPVETHPAPQSAAAGNASGTIASTGVFQALWGASSARLGCVVQNNGSHDMWLGFGGSPTEATSVKLAAGQVATCAQGGGVASDAVSITGTAGDVFFATQGALAIGPAPGSATIAGTVNVQGTGTAGTQAGGVLTVQGDPSGTAIPITGSISATNPSVGTTAAAVPGSATYVAGDKGGNLTGLSLDASGNLNVNVAAGGGSGGTSSSFSAAFPATGTAAGASDGTNMKPFLVDGSGNLKVAQQGSVAVTGTFWQATQPVSASALPLPTGASTEATLAKVPLAQGSTTSGQSGALVQGATTTAAPTYTTGQTDPLSLTTAGALRVDGSASTQPVSGTVTANAGTGTFAISAASLPLPTGAATAAKQPAIGTAGTASSDVLTVQGIASMTPLLVNGSGSTQPVSGTVTANAGTGTFGIQPVDTTASGTITTQNLVPGGTATAGSAVAISLNGTGTVTIQVTGTYTGALSPQITTDGSTWVTQLNNLVLLNMNTGAATNSIGSGSTGIWQIEVNGHAQFRITALAPVTGTATITLRGAMGTSQVSATVLGSGLTAPQVQGSSASGASDIGAPVKIGGVFNTTQPTVSNGQRVDAQMTTRGAQIVAPGVDNFAVQAAQSGTWNINNISGTVSLPTGASTEATLAKIPLAQGSTTSGQSGSLVQGAVTTGAPTYTTAQTSPLSLTTAGALRVDGSATTQPVSGTFWQTTQPVSIAGNQAVNLAQVAGASTATGHGTASGAIRVELPTDGTGVVNTNPMGLQLANAGSAAINVSTATTTQIVALSSGKAIYVTSFDVIAGGTGNITFEYGTGASCGTGTTALTGAYNLTAQSGLAKGAGVGPVLVVPASNALCVLTSAAVQMSGSVSYVQQ